MADMIAEMRALVADLDAQHRRETQAYRAGYRDGYATGYDLGEAHAEHRIAEDWRELAARVRAHGRASTARELAEMDASAAAGVPCDRRCGRCSRCIRAAAVARRGGDYTGGPVPWEGRPVRRTA